MPVVINSVDVSPERSSQPEGQAQSGPTEAQKPDPEEIRRLLAKLAERQRRLQAH